METSLLWAVTCAWLAEPSTWVAVLGPGVLSAWAFWRHSLSRREFLLLLLCIALGVLSSRLTEHDGMLALYSHPWLPLCILAGAAVRHYLPKALKAYAMCWVCAFGVDVVAMTVHSQRLPEVRLPYGIGGAGLGDGLFIEPLSVAVGLGLLHLARRWDERRQLR